uniref:fibronectin type III domain-containing protein n=1 Tax=Eubacterium sp. TaxID=142586 RepID=UPI003FEE1CFE
MKKALSIFLSLVMLLTMSAGLNITARAEQSVKSSFDEATGTLTFTGKGTVSASSYDYGNIGDKITKVIVNVGIDEIQGYAFSKAVKLQSVIIYDQTCQISAQDILPIGKDDVTFYGFDKSKTQEWALNHKYPFKYIYTITFLKRNNSVSKIIYALDGETAQEISAKAPNFSFNAYPDSNTENGHFEPTWKPSISAATSDKQYKEHPKLRMCTGIQKITKEPTCAETGVLSTVCDICKRTLETKELAKTNNHVFDNNEEFCLVCHKVKNPNYTTTTTTTSAPTTQPTTKPTTTKASKPTKNAKKVSGNWVDGKYKKASISKLSKGKKAITVRWKKVSTIKGYQIQLATDKKFKKNKKTVTISKQKTTKTTVKKLKAKKKYYVRIRTYKNVKYKGKTIKVYSSWSKVKTVKTK